MAQLWKSEEVKEAVHCIYNGQRDKADEIIGNKKKEHARFALHSAENLVVFMMMTDSKEDQQASWSALVEAEKLAVEYKKKIGGNKKAMDSAAANELLDAKVVLAEIHMLMAFYCVVDGADKIKGVTNINSAYNITKDNWKEINSNKKVEYDQDLKDIVKFNYGIFTYFIAMLPDFAGQAAAAVAKVFGFSGNKEEGEKMLLEVANSDSIRSPFSRGMLALKWLFLPDRDFPCQDGVLKDSIRALESCQDGLQKYPTSPGFLFMMAAALRKQGKAQEGCSHLTKLQDTLAEQSLRSNVITLHVGHCYFLDMDWANAITYYEDVCKAEDRKDPFLSLWFRAAVRSMTGDESGCIEDVKLATKLAEREKKSDLAKEMSRYLENGLHKLIFYELIVVRKEVPAKDKCPALLEHLDQVEKELMGLNLKKKSGALFSKTKAEPWKMPFVGSKCMILARAGRSKEALTLYQELFQLKAHANAQVEKEMFWLAHFDCAEILYEMGKKDQSKQLLKEAASNGHSYIIKSSAKAALADMQ